MNTIIPRLARPLEFLLGVIFVVAALLKAMDPNLFAAQIYTYRIVQSPDLLALVALTTLGLETFLGVAMLLGLRLRMLVLTFVQAMLVFFTVVVLYAWLVHGLTDCGCFGKVKMTPPMAISKNVLMIVAAAIAWRGIRLRGIVSPGGALWRTLVSGVLAALVTAYAAPALSQADPSTPPSSITPGAGDGAGGETVEPQPPAGPGAEAAGRPFAQFQVQNEFGETLNLGEGRYLVTILSAVCDHCMSMVPHLNELYLNPDLPPLVAIMYSPSPQDLETFTLQTGPLFPIHSLGNNFIKFSEFIGNHPPRLSVVEDGVMLHHWDPSEEEHVFAAPEEILEKAGGGAVSVVGESPG